MHTRKQFIVYPPNYRTGDGYKVCYSKRQAWKSALRMGEGASVDVSINKHPRPRAPWISSSGRPLWDVVGHNVGIDLRPTAVKSNDGLDLMQPETSNADRPRTAKPAQHWQRG